MSNSLYHCRFGQIPLLQAAETEHREMVALLLAKGAAVDRADGKGWTALHWAADKGDCEVAAVLLENGATMEVRNKDRKTPMGLASLKGHLRMVNLLLSSWQVSGSKNVGRGGSGGFRLSRCCVIS